MFCITGTTVKSRQNSPRTSRYDRQSRFCETIGKLKLRGKDEKQGTRRDREKIKFKKRWEKRNLQCQKNNFLKYVTQINNIYNIMTHTVNVTNVKISKILCVRSVKVN